MHLVGFIIRICHDARSPERQIPSKMLIIICNLTKGPFFLPKYGRFLL